LLPHTPLLALMDMRMKSPTMANPSKGTIANSFMDSGRKEVTVIAKASIPKPITQAITVPMPEITLKAAKDGGAGGSRCCRAANSGASRTRGRSR